MHNDFKTIIIKRKKINFFLLNSNKFLDFINEHKIAVIINCIGESRKNLDFSKYIESNIKIPTKILSIISNKKIAFINFSSQDEDKVDQFFEERIFPKNNKSNYAISKSIFTKILQKNIFNNYIMNLKIPVIYGDNAPKHMLYGEAVEKYSLNKYFFIKNPYYLNNFINIKVLVKILELLLVKQSFKKKYYYDIVSNNRPETVHSFITFHFPNIKIKMNSSYNKKNMDNRTLITQNNSIMKFFK